MRALRLAAAAGLMLATGCSALTPYSTTPLAPKSAAVDLRTRVAICFNKLKTSPDQVQQQAQAECPNNSVPELIDTDYRLEFCPIAVPGRSTFVCVPQK